MDIVTVSVNCQLNVIQNQPGARTPGAHRRQDPRSTQEPGPQEQDPRNTQETGLQCHEPVRGCLGSVDLWLCL